MDISKINSAAGNSSLTSMSKDKISDDKFEKHLESAFTKKDEQQLRKACKEFESVLLNMMYKQMKATVPKSDLIPSDMGKDIFESMLDEKLMVEASNSKGVGLSDMLYKQLSRRLKDTYKPSNGGGSSEIVE